MPQKVSGQSGKEGVVSQMPISRLLPTFFGKEFYAALATVISEPWGTLEVINCAHSVGIKFLKTVAQKTFPIGNKNFQLETPGT